MSAPPAADRRDRTRNHLSRLAAAVVKGAASTAASVAAVLLVIVWVPSYFVIGNLDTWQLIINTATTIITFLLVALLQNTQIRADRAVQDKLNAIADGLADLMTAIAEDKPGLHHDVEELKDAVGLEDRESA